MTVRTAAELAALFQGRDPQNWIQDLLDTVASIIGVTASPAELNKLDTVGLLSAAYSASARVISGIVVTVGAAGNAGRTRMLVTYALPTAGAATKA